MQLLRELLYTICLSPDMFDMPRPGVDQGRVETGHGHPPPGVLQTAEFRGRCEPQFCQTLGITGGQGQDQPLLGAQVGEDECQEAADVQLLVAGEHSALLRPASGEEYNRRIGQRRQLDWRIIPGALHHSGVSNIYQFLYL